MDTPVQIRFTEKQDLITATPNSYTQAGPQSTVIVYADRDVHISTEAEATEDDFFLKAETYFSLRLEAGQTVSVLLADGETSGVIRFTEAS